MARKTPIGAPMAWVKSTSLYDGDECVDWPFGWVRRGYGSLMVEGKRMLAHRYMCELAHGTPASGELQAAHSCGRRSCVNPRHLRWATPSENAMDMKIHGVAPIGEKHGRARLKESDVLRIRSLVGVGVTAKEIAKEYGVHPSTVSLAASGKNWAHL